MRSRILGSALALAVVASPMVARGSCETTDVCSDVLSSFYGWITSEGITVAWSTDDEGATLAAYTLKRYDCTDPATCSVDLVTIGPDGQCGVNEEYLHEDEPPTGDWTYTLEVWKTDNTRACAIDAVPQ